MGIDCSIYIGPVLRIPNTKVKTLDTVHGCPNCKTVYKFSASKYCADCGKKVEPYQKEVEEPLDVDALFQHKEPLFEIELEEPVQYRIFGSNLTKGQPRQFLTGMRDTSDMFYTPETFKAVVENEGSWFEITYQHEITKLKEVFGEEGVWVGWGVFTWWH